MEELRDSIAEEPGALPVSEEPRRELDRRLEAHRESPHAAAPWSVPVAVRAVVVSIAREVEQIERRSETRIGKLLDRGPNLRLEERRRRANKPTGFVEFPDNMGRGQNPIDCLPIRAELAPALEFRHKAKNDVVHSSPVVLVE